MNNIDIYYSEYGNKDEPFSFIDDSECYFTEIFPDSDENIIYQKDIQLINEKSFLIIQEKAEDLEMPVKQFNKVINKLINFDAKKNVPKKNLEIIYNTIKKNPKYKNWQNITSNDMRNRDVLLYKLSKHGKTIIQELRLLLNDLLPPINKFNL